MFGVIFGQKTMYAYIYDPETSCKNLKSKNNI